MQPDADTGQDNAVGATANVQTSNGPVSNGEKSWMRAWELGEIWQQASDWNLAADAGLLQYLQAFSLNFMQKAQESTLGINNLTHDTNMADARVRNVTDRFMTLSDSQFIENRVYDEDVSPENNEDTKEKEQDGKEEHGNVDPFPKIKDAIQMGLKVLEDAFDILDANAANSDYDSELDSDDDDEKGANGLPEQKLYEPKDPYVARPLPYLIGSRGFQEYDDVGIRDLPSDDEVAQDDEGSISESDEDIEKPSSYQEDSADSSDVSYSDTDESGSIHSDEDKSGQVARKLSSISASAEEDNLFDKSDDDFSDHSTENQSIKRQKSPQKKKPKKTRKPPPQSDLFGSDEDNDGDDLFGDAGGLFGNAPNLFDKKKTGGGLFDGADISEEDSEKNSHDEGDDESQKLSSDEDVENSEEEKVSKAKSSKPQGGISLFGGALNKELLSKTRKDSATSRSDSMSQASVSSSKKATNLFVDEEDSAEDELFSSKSPKSKPSAKAAKSVLPKSEDKKKPLVQQKEQTAKKRQSVDLFGSDSDDNDLFGDAPPQNSAKAITQKSSSQNNASKANDSNKKKTAIFDSASSDEDSMFSKKPPPMKVTPKSGKTSSSAKSKGLFDSDSDDDFFGDKPASNLGSGATPKTLLDSDSDGDLFSAIPIGKKKSEKVAKKPNNPNSSKTSSLFGDSDGDDFSDVISKNTKDSFEEKVDAKTAPLLKKSDDLFVDDSEDEFQDEKQEPTPPPARKKPAGAVAMFGGGFGGGELSAAILKRRGVSDISSKSTSSVSSKEDKGEPIRTGGEDDKEKDHENAPEVPMSLESKSKPKVESKTLLNSTAKPFKPFGGSMPSKKTVTGFTEATSQSAVSDLRSTLSINPSSLLPGATRKPKPVVQTEISFDKPPDHKTLDSVNKTRARGQRNRRPPSRHLRGKLSLKSDQSNAPSFVEKPLESEDNSSEVMTEVKRSDSNLNSDVEDKSKSANEPKPEDILQHKENSDLFGEPMKKSAEKPKSLIDSTDFDDELFTGSLFTKSEKKSQKPKTPKLFDDDIFGDGDDFLSELTSTNKKSSAKISDVANVSDDDIFGDLSIGSILTKKGKKETSASCDNDLFGENETTASNPTAKSTKTEAKPSNTTHDDADDDIFGETDEPAKSKLLSKVITSSSVDDVDIFGDNDDLHPVSAKPKSKEVIKDDSDIFGTESSVIDKPKKPKSKLTAAPDDDIFGDDIFASTSPTVKKKAKKSDKKQKSSKVSAGASIFDDDDDMSDIFAASTTKPKKPTSKSASKKTDKTKQSKTTSSTVMDDPLSMP